MQVQVAVDLSYLDFDPNDITFIPGATTDITVTEEDVIPFKADTWYDVICAFDSDQYGGGVAYVILNEEHEALAVACTLIVAKRYSRDDYNGRITGDLDETLEVPDATGVDIRRPVRPQREVPQMETARRVARILDEIQFSAMHELRDDE